MDEQLLQQTLERHNGVITLAQARAAGLTATMISTLVWAQRWRRVAPRTYLVVGHRRSEEARVRTAVSATGGVLHEHSAAWWHGMLSALAPAVDVTVSRAGRPRTPQGARLRRRDLRPRDTGAGWTVLGYTWHQLTADPERVLAEVAAAGQRGLTVGRR